MLARFGKTLVLIAGRATHAFMRTVRIPAAVSLCLALGSLAAVIFWWPSLSRFGLHGIAIIFLLFQNLTLLGIVLSVAEGDRLSVARKRRQFFRAAGAMHLILLGAAGATYALRYGVKFVFEQLLPDAFEELGEYAFIVLLIGLSYLVFRYVPAADRAVDRFRDWLDL